MAERYSRRDFLIGVLACGTLTAGSLYLLPGGRSIPAIELTLVTGADDTGARDLLIEMWNRANPSATVRTIVVQGDTGDQRRAMVDLARSGRADILNLDIIHIPYFAREELITPIEIDDPNAFLDRTLMANRVDGETRRYWAVPFNTDVGLLFQRVSGDALAPDRVTLAEVIDDAPAGSRRFVGQLRPTASVSHEAFVVNLLEHALSRDPSILAEDGTPSYDLPRWRNALEPLAGAIADGRIALADTEANTIDQFMAIDGSRPQAMRNWPVAYRTLQERNDVDVRAGRIRVDSLPIGVLGGQSLALVSRSPHHSAAVEFIRFVTDEAAQKVLAAHGLAPTRIAAYNDVNLQAFIPHLATVRGAVETARPRPIHPNYAEFAATVVRHGQALLHEGTELPPQFIEELVVSLV
jgi:multiple sugar transport system substrate-binding protein